MTGKLMFVPDTHVVVPREPNEGQLELIKDNRNYGATAWEIYTDAINAAPQLTTPPVLRWEGEWLILGDEKIAVSTDDHCGCFWVTLLQNDIGGRCESMEAGRRAAEKALGLPIVEEV